MSIDRDRLDLWNLDYYHQDLIYRLAMQPKWEEITTNEYCVLVTKIGNRVSEILNNKNGWNNRDI